MQNIRDTPAYRATPRGPFVLDWKGCPTSTDFSTDGMFGGGLFVGAGAYPTGTLDTTCNWWNDPCGPFNVTNNPDGIGEEVQEAVPSTVDFSPWLIAPGPAPASGTGTCSGTASTCRLTTTTTTTPSSTLPAMSP